MKQFACKNCEARTAGCHDTCEQYAKVRAARAEEKAARWRDYEADSYRRFVVARNKAIKVKERAKH